MFSKKIADVKKSTLKIQDTKKDLTTRCKHLKIILENSETSEAKGLFEANFSHIYNILYDSFIQAETNLRQRVHKAHKEELEYALWILEQVLCLLPELIHKRWQIHSLSRILSKLLHPGNSLRLRRQAIRYFLMWYQALNDNAPDYVHEMFANLVPGFSTKNSPDSNHGSVFHDTNIQNPISSSELLPILPPSAAERQPEHATKLFFDTMLDYMVVTVVRLDWHDKSSHHHRCFHFLLEMFKLYYLPKLFPNFNHEMSLYTPNLELPTLRKGEPDNEYVTCKVSFIKWITTFMHQTKKNVDIASTIQPYQNEDELQHESSHPSLDSTISLQTTKRITDEELAAQIVREVFCNTRNNVNFLHEVYRQAFLLNFAHSIAIRKTIAMYKDLIQLNMTELPQYVLEPPEDVPRIQEETLTCDGTTRPLRLRNDSYLGAIHKENLLVRAGMQNILQLFMTHASNVFLLEVNSHHSTLLEEQTDACKRVLNIYRHMVMHTRMDNSTWEQLLLVLLQITSLVLGENPPKRKEVSLGGKLAPAIFQTLIVTWIKANLNVLITRDLWDRFLYVLTSLTNWEELIREWAKTMETLTRVLARHVYNLDLTDLPLDRLSEQKSKRVRKNTSRSESNTTNDANEANHNSVVRQDSMAPDGRIANKLPRIGMSRSFSETNLAVKRRNVSKTQQNKRKSLSLDNLRQMDTESTDRTRSPSPAPSSGIESTSIKDSPIQLDVLSNEHTIHELSGEHRGVICGGTIRGWVPDVAVILWRRMLGALGDVNQIEEPKHHAQVFEYLVKLTDTLIKIKLNQAVSGDNMSTPPPPELIPPLTLILPWCFGALSLPNNYEPGKLYALRLLCTILLNTDNQFHVYLPHFYRALHLALTGSSKSALNTTLKYLGPRFLSLQLPGATLLLLDLVQACNNTLNSSDLSQNTPRTEAVSILGGLLSYPDELPVLSVLQPDQSLHVMACPDVKEHVVSILLRAGRREPTAMARCVALSALGMFVYKELTKQIQIHPKIVEAMKVILLALKINNKTIAQLASNTLFLLCDCAATLWAQYPRIGDSVIRTLCAALFLHAPLDSTACESDKSLSTALLLCLGEWCMRIGPNKLQEVTENGDCLLLLVFNVLHTIINGKTTSEGLTQPNLNEDFDPNILLDNVAKSSTSSPLNSPSKNQSCQRAITLCAKTVLAHLVNHLGHFPMAIGAARLSSLVVEHDDVPNFTSDELSANIFTAPNIQLFVLTQNVVASLIELPALKLPGGGVTAGLSTADKQVRVLLRDLSGKASWDASILYRTPEQEKNTYEDDFSCNKWGAENNAVLQQQLDSLMLVTSNVPQKAIRERLPNVLPEVCNAAPDLDQLHDLLQYIGYTSPECLENFEIKLNELKALSGIAEPKIFSRVMHQKNIENSWQDRPKCYNTFATRRPCSSCKINQVEENCTKNVQENAPKNSSQDETHFQQCRLLFSQLGLGCWERRTQLHLLNKTERLIRELRNLDTQRCRETHKVAVIYVAPGQEDKNSILSNQGGSAAYEQFLASLAWEVELEGHTGFLGGLQRQGSTGLTAPYVATSFLEAIFHVATRMPSDTPETVLSKTRHLGNDEVHIVWSEHNRDYRRDIIPTEFCDVLITIYPLGNQMNRVTLNCKPEIPYFGVLFNEAIVESSILAGIVRATVICASRAKRTTLSFYQQYYEERAKSLETVVTKHKDNTTYEDFISRVYCPITTSSQFGPMTSSGGNSLDNVTSGNNLANALLDSHGHLNKMRDQKFRTSDSFKGVWFVSPDTVQNVESTSISPRPLKKLSNSLKNVPKRTIKPDNLGNETPPDSPPQLVRKK